MNDITNFPVVISDCIKSMGVSLQGLLILISMVVCLLVLFIWFASKKVKLWNGKTNEQIQVLQSIDERLKNMEEKKVGTALVDGYTKAMSEESVEAVTVLDEAEATECHVKQETFVSGMSFNIGRSGKVYTADELELQIRE